MRLWATMNLPAPVGPDNHSSTCSLQRPFLSFTSRKYSGLLELILFVLHNSTIPLFETIIRYLGGLISAFDLSQDPLMLARATELGDWLLPALNTKHGLALGRYLLGQNPDGAESGNSCLAEVGSLGLEFFRLSMITGDPIYAEAVRVSFLGDVPGET